MLIHMLMHNPEPILHLLQQDGNRFTALNPFSDDLSFALDYLYLALHFGTE